MTPSPNRTDSRPRPTESQLAAITSKAPRTLVSAAAGSGKTSVLTERIVALVCGADLDQYDPEGPVRVDVDRMTDIGSILVMTFTRSAAAEMRGRIISKLNEAARGVAQSNPEAARRLYEQAEKAAGADISTVHSFCQHLLADHYEIAGIAPRTGVLTETQQAQVMDEAMRQVFQDRYEAGDSGLITLLQKHTKSGDDTAITGDVLRVYRKMMGMPDWNGWLSLAQQSGRVDTIVAEWQKDWEEELEQASTCLDAAMDILRKAGGFDKELKRSRTLRAKLDKALAAMHEKHDIWLARQELPATPGLSKLDNATGEIAAAAAYHGRIKDIFDRLRTECVDDPETARYKIEEAHKDAGILAGLAAEFEQEYSKRKRALNKIDFDDMEHMALSILLALARDAGQQAKAGVAGGEDNGGEAEAEGPDAADDGRQALKRRYTHIFVDEYQDTNPVQEAILEALQRLQPDAHVFMVGDLKQSIYAFRAADSSIFSAKDIELSMSDSGKTVYMNDNFRSAPAVIDAVNSIMGCVMAKNLGGVEYDEDQSLRCGPAGRRGGVAQIMLAESQGRGATQDADGAEETEEISPEASMIAQKIEELVQAGIPYGDPDASPYSKIAVLSRTRSSQAYLDLPAALDARGIPYWLDEDKYQSFTELDLFLNLLELTVNDRKDVPLLSVLRSYMYGLDERDFARIVDWYEANKTEEDIDLENGHASDQAGEDAAEQLGSRQLQSDRAPMRVPFFQQLGRFHNGIASGEATAQGEMLETFEKVDAFFRDLDKLRVRGTDMALDKFVEEVAAHYDFGGYLLTRPNGANRRRAFDDLVQTIREQHQVSGNSLYRVLDAVRRGRRKKVAPSMADSVRIMTMHRSKGLEYPIVFVTDLNHGFNTRDSSSFPLLDSRYGIIMNYVDEEEHSQSGTLETAVVSRHIARAAKSEEVRALYVAMTRARDELYLCGTADRNKGVEDRWSRMAGQNITARSMLDWVMGAVSLLGRERRLPEGMYDAKAPWYTLESAQASRRASEDRCEAGQQAALGMVEENEHEEPAELFDIVERKRVPAVQSVSKVVSAERLRSGRPLYSQRAIRPLSSADPDALTGAERGTALHDALQYAVRENSAILRKEGRAARLLDGRAAVERMLSQHLVTPETAGELEKNAPSLDAFLESSLYQRVRNSPHVLVEQRFTLLVGQNGVLGSDSAQKMRLQGRIDLAFEEDGKWVLVDYKSDRASSEKELRERYGQQMGWYKRALESATGMPVSESYLFSLERGKAIRVGEGDMRTEQEHA